MYQPKVKGVHEHSDNHEEDMVCKGKLKFIYQPISQGGKIPKPDGINRIYKDGYELKPIIISETEEIEIGDKVLYKDTSGYLILTLKTKDADRYWWEENSCSRVGNKIYKILALPEQFSDKHLQDIVDDELDDGDEVLVKCEHHIDQHPDWRPSYDNPDDPPTISWDMIHLDQQNHITLFPIKQSLEEAAKEYGIKTQIDWHQKIAEKSFKAGAKWAKNNNY